MYMYMYKLIAVVGGRCCLNRLKRVRYALGLQSTDGQMPLIYRPLMGFYVVGFQPPSLGTNFLELSKSLQTKWEGIFPQQALVVKE